MCGLSKAGPASRLRPWHTPSLFGGHIAHHKNGVSGQLFLHCGSGQPNPALGWMRGLRVNFFVNNDTIPEKCSISRIQLLELGLGRGAWRVFRVWALGGSLPRGGMCVCACVHAFSQDTLFSDACVDSFWESPGEKEKVQNAVTPDGKYYALVNGADVSPLTLAFRLNQTSARKDEAHMEPSGLVTVPLQWHCLNSKLLGKMLSESYSACVWGRC